ncbi:hypothetical protein TURU_018133 [Turdus rufiventris]|nr:hypothetical protein TURU_018133 [Turdus rufiventris]
MNPPLKLAWQGWGTGGALQRCFHEKLLEASPMSGRANASWTQDGPITGPGQAYEQWWKVLGKMNQENLINMIT